MLSILIVKIIIKLTQKYVIIKNKFYTKYYLHFFLKHGEKCQFDSTCSFHGLEHITIGNSLLAGPRFTLRAFSNYGAQCFLPKIIIGDFFYCGRDCYISGIGKIIIGNHVTLASRITIIDHNHIKKDFSDLTVPVLQRELNCSGPIIIDNNVWVGENAVILSNVHIGKNSIIGAGSVVTHDIPENAIAVGNPAKVIKIINLEK